MRYLVILLLLALILITAGCTTSNPPVTPQETITIVATPTPEPTITRPLPGMDPIIGAWDNGMVFKADGSVGDDGITTWKANDMVKNSYFITTITPGVKDVAAGRIIDPSASATEWIYNPQSDTIHIRDSTTGVRRVLPGSVVPAPAGK